MSRDVSGGKQVHKWDAFLGGVIERGGGGVGILKVSSCGFSQGLCMMGRETSLSSLCQLTLPVSGCLPLIHTPLQQAERKRENEGVRGGKRPSFLPFLPCWFHTLISAAAHA